MRLDSGDFVALSKQVRQVLDEAGWRDVTIFASGDLNEYKIENLLAAGGLIDSFGVGTELVTVADAPSLGVLALERRLTYPVEISSALQAEYDRLARLQAVSAT